MCEERAEAGNGRRIPQQGDADPTGEVLNIIGGAVLGGIFGGAGGLISSAVSQKLSGEKVNWRKAWGAAANGAITGAVQGGLVASGAGIPVALASNFLAGAAGSAAEQYISEGKVDARKSITSGLANAVSNAIYGTRPLKSVGGAFLRGAGAGAATAGINYISDFIRQNPGWSGIDAGSLSGMAGKLISLYGLSHDPKKGCGSFSPFARILGYDSAKGYRYNVAKTTGLQKQKKKFDFGEFLGAAAFGGIVGGVTSAAFYGTGKGIGKLKDSFQSWNDSNKYKKSISNPLPEKATLPMDMDLQFFAKKSDIKQIEKVAKQFKMSPNQRRDFGDYIESLKIHKRNDANYPWKELMQIAEDFLRGE